MLEFLAQNLLSINCLLRSIAPLFYRFFWFSSYRTRELEVKVAHTIKAPLFGTILVELRNGMYRTTRLLWVVDPLDLYNFGQPCENGLYVFEYIVIIIWCGYA